MSIQPGIKFIYLFCNDLQAMRQFYTDLLGLDEIYYADEPEGTVAYDCDGLQFTIVSDAAAQPASLGWARQPGWQGGTEPVISWSVPLTGDGFRSAVDKLKAAGAKARYEVPRWNGYWGFPVKDPMGNTVELALPLEEEPASTEWVEESLVSGFEDSSAG